ncbi:hypothetical protein ACFWPV_12980 [Streptomyces uncialis]|uniref:hypothetical protein n=1 Tax=Streptomyces uncialis TaxID=1048205 RepID=UPI0036556DDC
MNPGRGRAADRARTADHLSGPAPRGLLTPHQETVASRRAAFCRTMGSVAPDRDGMNLRS